MKIRQQTGFTLVEVLLILAMVGILMGLFVLDYTADIKNIRLKEATTQLYSDLKKVRIDAMTRSSSGNSRGYGFNFTNDPALCNPIKDKYPDVRICYQLFEFTDTDDDFTYDSGENTESQIIGIPNNVEVSKSPDPLTLTVPLLYDRRGWLRNASWATTGGDTFILSLPGVTVPRCIVLSTSQIRQGRWEGGVCE